MHTTLLPVETTWFAPFSNYPFDYIYLFCSRYNPQLVQDESSCFHVTVSSSQPFSSLAVSALKSPGLLLEKSVTRSA